MRRVFMGYKPSARSVPPETSLETRGTSYGSSTATKKYLPGAWQVRDSPAYKLLPNILTEFVQGPFATWIASPSRDPIIRERNRRIPPEKQKKFLCHSPTDST